MHTSLFPTCAPDTHDEAVRRAEAPETTETEQSERVAFEINSEDRANWYLRQMANLSAEKERIKANSARMLADIKQREDGLKARFEVQLQQWVKDELIRRKSKKKSLPLFQGVVSFRTVNASYYIADPEAAMTFARTFHPEMLETKLILNAATYIEAAKESRETEKLDNETGELVPGNLLPGTDVKPAYESMSIRFVAPVGAIDSDDTDSAEGANIK